MDLQVVLVKGGFAGKDQLAGLALHLPLIGEVSGCVGLEIMEGIFFFRIDHT